MKKGAGAACWGPASLRPLCYRVKVPYSICSTVPHLSVQLSAIYRLEQLSERKENTGIPVPECQGFAFRDRWKNRCSLQPELFYLMLEWKQQNQCGEDYIQAKHAGVRQLSLQGLMLSNALAFPRRGHAAGFVAMRQTVDDKEGRRDLCRIYLH